MFGTEQALREQDYPRYLVNAIRSDSDAMLYQFVVKGFPSAEHGAPPWRSANGERALHRLWTVADEKEESLAEKDAAHASADEAARGVRKALRESQTQLMEQDAKLWYLWNEHEATRQSMGYRLLERYRRLVRWLLPPGSRRGRAYTNVRGLVWRCCALIFRSLRLIRREGIRRFVGKAATKLAKRSERPGDQEEPADTMPVPELDMRIKPLTFPSVATARISIVIPVYNKAVHTYNCLKSVLESSDGVPYEVVVVNDGSSDETATMLSEMTNVRVVTNTQNVGFLEACNRGMEASASQYVVLLNNDTKVGNGWLTALFETIDSDDSIGMVGAKLIYPSGKLQEAGGVVWNDGWTWVYGRDDDPLRPEYNYVREVDYCSAACVIIRRKLLERTRGFDSDSPPGYYEDTDLAFQMRSMRYRVLYQPRAQVVHRERTSSDTGTAERLQMEHRSRISGKMARSPVTRASAGRVGPVPGPRPAA